MKKELSIYEQMKAAGVTIANHCSDLYAEVNEKSTAIVAAYEFKCNVTTFQSAIEGEGCFYDIPFAFDPYWQKREDPKVDARAAKTKKVHAWMKSLNDDQKMRFALNWRIPHSLFNVACKMYDGGANALQDVDWYSIHKSRDMGTFSHGGSVNCLGM